MNSSVRNYLQSASTRYGYCVGAIMFLSYARAFHAWRNSALWGLGLSIGAFIPFYARFSNQIEERIQFRVALVTPGRVGRFLAQFAFNAGIFSWLERGGVIPEANLASLGGVWAAAGLTAASSQGIQYLALALANREIGDKNRNVLAGLSVNIVIAAMAALGLSWARSLFTAGGAGLGSALFGLSLLSDIRSRWFPRGGVGIFFGTFNPFHKTHLEIIRKAIETRGLERVYLHSTVIPKLHREALASGEIRIASIDAGMRVYEKTHKADLQVNYFPTGSRFFEYSTRTLLMRLAIEQAGLSEKVVVLELPDVYEETGFYGIIAEIRRRHPVSAIHGMHGSDLGGMWIRSIYDESGGIYPYPVRRIDGVSATAIREGATGMASPVVEEILRAIRSGAETFRAAGTPFEFRKGVLNYEFR
jgi:hypothetical protein